MASTSPRLRLQEMVEAIELVTSETAGLTIKDLEGDKRKRWVIERGIEIISEASRRLPDEMKDRHQGIPWRKVAGIGNILRHEYEQVAHDVLWRVVHDELPPLDAVCRAELEALDDQGN